MLNLLVIALCTGFLPVLINKSTDDERLNWLKRWLREAWTLLSLIFAFAYLQRTDMVEKVAKWHASRQSAGWYFAVAVVGAATLCAYWWFVGLVLRPDNKSSLASPKSQLAPTGPAQFEDEQVRRHLQGRLAEPPSRSPIHAPIKPPPPGNYMTVWGLQPGLPPGTQMTVSGDGEVLSGPRSSQITAAGYLLNAYADHYRLLGVCFHWSGKVDFKEQEGILRSAAMDIEPYPVDMLIEWDASFVKEMPRAKGTNYALLLIPKTLDGKSINSISDALSKGGFLLGTGNGPPGGFGEFHEIPPPTQPQ